MIFTNDGKSFSNGQTVCSALKEFLEKNKDSFERSLIPDLSHIDNRAENINGIDISEVTYQGNGKYQLDYSYDWFVYRGCSDMDEYDESEESVMFSMDEKGNIEFVHRILKSVTQSKSFNELSRLVRINRIIAK